MDTRLTELLKAKVQNQCKCVVEIHQGYFMVMFPDGCICAAQSRIEATRRCQRWFKTHIEARSIGIGEIEWRKVED